MKFSAESLSEIAWNGPIEELTKTSNCQPALYVHALAALAALRDVVGEFPIGGAAGLSLGGTHRARRGGHFRFCDWSQAGAKARRIHG